MQRLACLDTVLPCYRVSAIGGSDSNYPNLGLSLRQQWTLSGLGPWADHDVDKDVV
jgi:hypothetical protein